MRNKHEMDKTTEMLMKERETVANKCVGLGFTEEEEKFIKEKVCDKIEAFENEEDGVPIRYCKCYAFPAIKWRSGRCPMATNYRPDLQVEKAKERVGQQKGKRKKKG